MKQYGNEGGGSENLSSQIYSQPGGGGGGGGGSPKSFLECSETHSGFRDRQI